LRHSKTRLKSSISRSKINAEATSFLGKPRPDQRLVRRSSKSEGGSDIRDDRDADEILHIAALMQAACSRQVATAPNNPEHETEASHSSSSP
jgi:hypothetical protein